MRRFPITLLSLLLIPRCVFAEITCDEAVLFLDFDPAEPNLVLHHGVRRVESKSGHVLEFSTPLQYAEIAFSNRLDAIQGISVGGWFQPFRSGEQYFIFRGVPQVEPLGNRFFRPATNWVNFVLGTDQRGFLLGTANGNGSMPFPYVTVAEVPFDAWSQLVYIKTPDGKQHFYANGTLVHTDQDARSADKIWPFKDTAPGEPVRLAMPMGGRMGETWIFGRALSAEEIRRDYEKKRSKYAPRSRTAPVRLRAMNRYPKTGLWPQPLTAGNWPALRQELVAGAWQVLGKAPTNSVPLAPKMLGEVDCGSYVRRKVSLQVQPGDRMPAYLLVPKKRDRRMPAIICFYGTSSGAGKDTTVGLSGRKPGTPPQRNENFAIDMAEAGFVAFAADYLRDGERIKSGRRPYDTTDFYAEFPDWSIHGKDLWDTSRAIDYLQTLEFVDPEKIGMTGHSYGGHSTIFTAALDPRIKVAVANGPVSDFLHHGMHWAVPKGAGNSQSLPAMRPYVLDRDLPLPITFYGFTALIAPRPLLVGQAVGERRPFEEENCAAVTEVYDALGASDRVRYHWYAGDHDYPPEARSAAVEWFRRWFGMR